MHAYVQCPLEHPCAEVTVHKPVSSRSGIVLKMWYKQVRNGSVVIRQVFGVPLWQADTEFKLVKFTSPLIHLFGLVALQAKLQEGSGEQTPSP